MSWILFLSIVGILLVCLEVFMPGAIMGIIGALCLIAAVIVTYVLYGVTSGNLALLGLLIGSTVALILWITLFPRTRLGHVLVTQGDLADSKTSDSLSSLLGKEGQAITPLRPAGTARIEGRRVDVVAESGLIERDSKIKVVRVEGNRVMVRKI